MYDVNEVLDEVEFVTTCLHYLYSSINPNRTKRKITEIINQM